MLRASLSKSLPFAGLLTIAGLCGCQNQVTSGYGSGMPQSGLWGGRVPFRQAYRPVQEYPVLRPSESGETPQYESYEPYAPQERMVSPQQTPVPAPADSSPGHLLPVPPPAPPATSQHQYGGPTLRGPQLTGSDSQRIDIAAEQFHRSEPAAVHMSPEVRTAPPRKLVPSNVSRSFSSQMQQMINGAKKWLPGRSPKTAQHRQQRSFDRVAGTVRRSPVAEHRVSLNAPVPIHPAMKTVQGPVVPVDASDFGHVVAPSSVGVAGGQAPEWETHPPRQAGPSGFGTAIRVPLPTSEIERWPHAPTHAQPQPAPSASVPADELQELNAPPLMPVPGATANLQRLPSDASSSSAAARPADSGPSLFAPQN